MNVFSTQQLGISLGPKTRHQVDYAGRICGISPGVEDKPFVYVCGKAGAGFEAGEVIGFK